MMGEEPLHHEVPPSANNTGVASTHIVRNSSSNNNSNNSSSNTPLLFDPPYHHHHHHHQHIHQQQHNNHLFDSPSWDPHNNPIQQSTSSVSSVSHSRNSNPYATHSSSSSSASTTSGKTITPPRRTRHRVDAGEPRGCFNSSGLTSAGLAAASHFYHGSRNSNSHLFSASNRGGGAGTSGYSGGGYNNFIQPSSSQQQQHHHIPPHFPSQNHSPQNHFNQFGQVPHSLPPQQQQQQQHPTGSSPLSNEPNNYYFQPMKMISEFISSASAVAAAQAAQQSGNSRASRQASLGAQAHLHSQQQHQNQFLLREMLCKSAAASAALAASSQPNSQQEQQGAAGGNNGSGAQSQTGGSNRLNNNNIQKYGFEEDVNTSSGGNHQAGKGSKLDGMIGMMIDKLNSAASSTASVDEDFNDDEEMLGATNGIADDDKPEVDAAASSKSKSISPGAGSNPEVSAELNTEEQDDDEASSADAMDGVKEQSPVEKDSAVLSGVGASCTNNNNNINSSKDSQNELNKSSAADLLNNNTTPSSQQQSQQTQPRNKRKKYQPQRSDLLDQLHQIDGVIENGGGIDEDEEEMLLSGEVAGDEEDVDEMIMQEGDEENELNAKQDSNCKSEEESGNRRITRSLKRRIRGEGDMEEETLQSTDVPTENNNEEDDEDVSPDEYEARLLRSRRNEAQSVVLNPTATLRTISTTSTRVKRKLPEDFLSDMDEDEAMLLRQVASGSRSSAATTTDDAESIKQEFENEEDEQEAMINDDLNLHGQGSRRTLPVVRNLMRVPINNHRGLIGSNIKEAPLTRQLLTTERPTSNPSSSLSNNDQKAQISLLRQRNPAASPSAGDLPANFLQQWKENLKTTLMSHINELVEAQFSMLLGGGVLPGGIPLPPGLQQQARSLDSERRSLRESNNPAVQMALRQNAQQQDKGMEKRINSPPHSLPQQRDNPPPPRSNTPRDQLSGKPTPLMHLNGGGVLNTDKLSMLSSPPMNEKKLPVGRAVGNQNNEFSGLPPRFPFMQNLQNSHDQRPGSGQNGKPHFSNALVGLTQQHLQHQAVAAAAAAAAAGIENMFDSDGALSLVVGNRQGGNGGGIVAEQLHGGNVTPRKKRHKVTDTRLTPRAVSRLLGQVDSSANSTSPLYDHHRMEHSTSPAGSPSSHTNNGPIEPRSILQNGTPPPSQQQRSSDREGGSAPRERTPSDRSASTGNQQNASLPSDGNPNPRLFNPFQPPTPGATPFFHPAAALAAAAAAGHPLHPHHQLGRLDSPPMGNSLLHPALQNPSEYVERLRGMSMERERDQERTTRVGSDNVVVRDRGDHHHHHPTLREYPSVRGLRDRSTGGGSIMLGNDLLESMMNSRAGSAGGGSDSGGESNSAGFDLGHGGMYCHTTSTLTPMHLRKAKLMFFWTRYPSSAVIKMYFPDIKFNKNNTAQLVKWFSNFREFYYIQMEKYARQALSEGVKGSEDLVVTTDSELYRVLNLHYNRNNHIEVPTNFRFVVEQTLREFFKSVQSGKDSEQSWKKAIYKIIARLDDPVPEYFKSPNFLEQLE